MQLFDKVEDFSNPQNKPLVLGLGFFDGVHLGHQKILKSVTDSAKKLNALPAVFTFKNHPQTVLRPDLPPPALITTPEQRLELLKKAGIEICFFVPFTETFSKMEAQDFVKNIFLEKLQAKKICLGYNAHFGHDRKGNSKFMRELAPKLGFEFEEIGPVEVKGEAVSSSRIRKLIEAGEMALAAECLGRPFSIIGKVIKGDGRGSEIGFPTANIETQAALFPPEGVYPVQVLVDGKTMYPGVLNFGRRPTFGGKDPQPILEAHLLDYMGDLYGRTLEVSFYPRLRGERAFKGVPELQLQIGKDIEAARRTFKA